MNDLAKHRYKTNIINAQMYTLMVKVYSLTIITDFSAIYKGSKLVSKIAERRALRIISTATNSSKLSIELAKAWKVGPDEITFIGGKSTCVIHTKKWTKETLNQCKRKCVRHCPGTNRV